jgi:hypothetical protein
MPINTAARIGQIEKMSQTVFKLCAVCSQRVDPGMNPDPTLAAHRVAGNKISVCPIKVDRKQLQNCPGARLLQV